MHHRRARPKHIVCRTLHNNFFFVKRRFTMASECERSELHDSAANILARQLSPNTPARSTCARHLRLPPRARSDDQFRPSSQQRETASQSAPGWGRAARGGHSRPDPLQRPARAGRGEDEARTGAGEHPPPEHFLNDRRRPSRTAIDSSDTPDHSVAADQPLVLVPSSGVRHKTESAIILRATPASSSRL